MSKTLYEEALADAKQLREIAESNAKRAIIASVTPKIKDLIESQLLGESESTFESSGGDNQIFSETEGCEDYINDEEPTGTTEYANQIFDAADSCVSEDEVVNEEETTYEMTSESMDALMPFSNRINPVINDKLELKIYELTESTNNLVIASSKIKATNDYITKINETIRQIEDMYSYVQASDDTYRKVKLEEKLEKNYSVLTAVKETQMRMKDLMSEANLNEDKEVSLKITGLPDDIELDRLNIDIISDEEEEMGAVPMTDVETDELTDEELPLPTADLEQDEEGDLEEGDDTVVEISESMLKREIARMKKLTEGEKVAPVNAAGEKMNIDILSDFGGGSDEGDAFLDGEVSTADKDNMVKQSCCVKESVDDEEELTEKHEDISGKMDDDHLPEAKRFYVSAKKSLSEAKLSLTSAQAKLVEAKKVYAKNKGGKYHAKAYALAESAWKLYKVSKANEETASRRFTVANKIIKESLKNSDSKQLAEATAANKSLRNQLAEVNLLNAKLIQANKLLQVEGLSSKQKATVIDKLDEARSLKDVKLVYEQLVSSLRANKASVNESANRSASGTSSRVTRSATSITSPVNESAVGTETARWALLAGLNK